MAYGREQYGQQPYGGSGFDGTGPSLVSTSPAAGDRNVPLDANVSFVLTSSGGFDPWALTVHLDNQPAIVGGAAQEPTFRASIIYSGDLCTVTITLHPDFTDSSYVSLQIWATDLSGVRSEFIIDFHDVFLVAAAEAVTEAEAAATQQAQQQPVAESTTVSDSVALLAAATLPVTETVAESESVDNILGVRSTVTETVTASDSVGFQQTQQLPLAQTVGLSESAIPSLGAPVGVADSVTTTDAVGVVWGRNVIPLETVPLSESAALHGEILVATAEAAGVSEAVAALRTTYMSVGETTPLGEGLTASAAGLENVADTVPVSEGFTKVYGAVANVVTDPISIVEDVVTAVRIMLFETAHVYVGVSAKFDLSVAVSDAPTSVAESVLLSTSPVRQVFETVLVSETGTGVSRASPHVREVVPVEVSVTVGQEGVSPADRLLRVRFHDAMALDGLLNLDNYQIVALGDAYPVAIETVTPLTETIQTGTGYVFSSTQTSSIVRLTTLSVAPTVGNYIMLPDGPARITAAFGPPLGPWAVLLDRALSFYPTPLTWSEIFYVGVTLTVTQSTDDREYRLDVHGLEAASGDPVSFSQEYTAVASKPRLLSTVALEDGQLLLTFSDTMRTNPTWFNPSEYSVTGPSSVEVQGVAPVSPTQVVLRTRGMVSDADPYTVQVNAAGTPKDVAGNPIDPVYNTAIFYGVDPIALRSVFTDKGPITKPPLTLQSGTGATVVSFTVAGLPLVVLSPNLVGKYLRLTGSSNAGVYRITGTIASTGLLDPPKVRIQASLTVPDPNSGSLVWEIFDPRDGEIADDPADVVVRINGTPVIPDAVVGLLGQVVLNARPAPADDVQVDYSWVRSPTVEVRRLNSREFKLNGWNRDPGAPRSLSGHTYRYNNILTTPSLYVPADMQAWLDQPQQRDLKYRAYERAYTAVLNDPTLLLLNSPTQRVAFPPLQRTVSPTFVSYDALTLPEDDSINPWERKGSGVASVSGGELRVQDVSGGPFPGGAPVFWVRPMDVTFDHVFAATWRVRISADPVTEGAFTGVSMGYSDGEKALLLGYLDEIVGSIHVRRIGILKKGSGNNPQPLTAWTGGLDALNNPTGAPVEFDWSILHSYRLFRGRDGWIKIFVDGGIAEVLRVHEDDLPYLEELVDPFNALEGVFFGSLSRPAQNTSYWTFFRYEILPTNPYQVAPTVFVNYEGSLPPEQMSLQPWTPIGYHGTETILSDLLLLDSTSATDATTESAVGLIDGDFRGFTRLEPLLDIASETVLDVDVAIRTFTHGITPNAVTAAVDDGERLIQLCLLSDQAAPKISYGGRSFPDEWTPVPWGEIVTGSASASIIGRTLRITDADTIGGLVYYADDTEPVASPDRIFSSAIDYAFEFRAQVVSYTPDPGGFCGVTADVYDSTAAVGIMLEELAGIRYVTLHSDGVVVLGGRFAFDWFDSEVHTYRVTKRGTSPVVSVFVDGVYVGSTNYSNFAVPFPSIPTGMVSFGSSTASHMAQSVVDWYYCNAWRVITNSRKYVGIWRGTEPDSFTGYHLPTKATGRDALVAGNSLGDGLASFTGIVVPGDLLVVDVGANKGVYEVAAVPAADSLTIVGTWPSSPSQVDYRILKETNWFAQHKYRVSKGPTGVVALLIDTDPVPAIQIGYNSVDLPPSSVGVFRTIAGGLPSVSFGAFDPTNISQTSWDFVRYGIIRSQTEVRIVPHHEILNQRNVMASPEHIMTTLLHGHTDYWSSSTGIPPKIDPDFLRNPGLIAFTLLNEGTPLVPLTQTAETRAGHDLIPIASSVSGLNRPEDILNSNRSFVLNDAAVQWTLQIPDNVLYNSLDVIETQNGELSLITPFCDGDPDFGTLYYQNRVCLTYDGSILPELDPNATTPWELVADQPSNVTRTAFAGVLTYGTTSGGAQTTYRNQTPLPDAPGLQTEVSFRIKLLNDTSGGFGDTQVRFGLSSPGMTLALGFITTPLGERYVIIKDLNAGVIVGGTPFDFGDGAFHTYRVVRDVGYARIQVFIDA